MSEISIIFGKLGKGKTMALTYFAYKSYLNGRTIYSNYKLNFPFTPIVTLHDLNKCRNGTVVLDEFWRTFRSRRAMSKENELVDQMIMCSRKRNLNLYCTAQSVKFLDIDIRRICNYYYRPHLEQQTWINKETGNPVEVTALELLKIDCYGNLIGTITCDISANYLASLYDTYEEIGKLNSDVESSFTAKSKEYEIALNKYIKKIDGITASELIPDSGRKHFMPCDIRAYTSNKTLGIEAKTLNTNNTRIYFRGTKDYWKDKIKKIKSCGNAIPVLVFPDPNGSKTWYACTLKQSLPILGMKDPSVSTVMPFSKPLKEYIKNL